MDNIFQMYELEAYLGDFVGDFDVDAIVAEVTEVDYRTGNRCWKQLEPDELVGIVRRHEKVWEGEGWYAIRFSDGGMDWTNDGPVWFEVEDDLVDEYMAAWDAATETHVPYVEYKGDGDKPDTDEDDEITEYMTRQGFGDYSHADRQTREEMEDLALEYAAQEQTRPTVFSKLGAERMAQRYANGTATAEDIISLRSNDSITKEEAEAYYHEHGWQLPKFGIR